MVRLACLISLMALATAAYDARADAHPLFQDEAELKAVLTAPLSQAFAQRHQEVRLYLPGQWTYMGPDGATNRLDVSIRTRGHFRREYCQLPPLQLNFRKSQVRGTYFTGQNKLKLVAPCKARPKYQQYVILEYLAYRTFQILTDHSFRTRLLRLTYVDSDEQLEPWTHTAFVIESDNDVAKRVGLDRLRVPSVRYSDLDYEQTALVHLYQLLIANNDYSVLRGSREEDCCHNVLVLGEQSPGTLRVPVPFDLDMSGIVNADYALPPSSVPVDDVRERYFNGLCLPQEYYDAAIARLQAKRDDIVALYRNSADLDERYRDKTLDYIDRFYAILDDPQRVEKEILDRCRGEKLMRRTLEASRDRTSDHSGPP